MHFAKTTACALALTGIFTGADNLLASTTSVLDSDLLTHYQALGTYSQRLAASPLWPTEFTPLTGMDGAKIGTATFANASNPNFYIDNNSNLKCNAIVSGTFRTYVLSSCPASWSATSNVILTETIRTGAAPGGSAGTLTIALTKTGSPANLTQAQLIAFLRGLSVTSYGTTATALNSSVALTSGWAATGLFKDSTSAAVAGVVSPIEATITLPVTVNGAAVNFTAAIKALEAWNVASNSTTAIQVPLTAAGALINIEALPAKLSSVATNGVATSLLNAFVALNGRFFAAPSASINSLYPANLAEADSLIVTRYVANNNAALYAKMASDAAVKALATDLVVGDWPTSAATNKYGLGSLDGAISNATWVVNDNSIEVTGKIGSGVPEVFSCNMGNNNISKAGTFDILVFSAPSGHTFVVRNYDSTGLDVSGVSTYGAGFQPTLLAAALVNDLGSTASIGAVSVDGLHH